MDDIIKTLQDVKSYLLNEPLIKRFEEFVTIDFFVAGGCVRDYLLDRPTKDIDVVLSFNFLKNYSYRLDDIRTNVDPSTIASIFEHAETQILEIFSRESEYSFVINKVLDIKEGYELNAMTGLSYVIQHCLGNSNFYQLNKAFDNPKKSPEIINANGSANYVKPKLKEHAYFNMGLSSVIMISDSRSKYPIELLLTAGSVEHFVSDFDFNLCKAYADDKGKIITLNEFEIDRINKTMTYTPLSYLTEKKIERSLIYRLERLAAKYPEYKLELDDSEIKDHKLLPLVQDHIKTLQCYQSLKNIPKKDKSTRVNKI